MKKEILSCMLTLAMALSIAVPVSATEITAPGGGQSDAVLSQEQSTFSVTVPTGLPVDVASDGTITVATDAEIRNNGFGPVEVTAVSVEPQNGWKLADFNTDFSVKKVGLHEFGFQLQGNNVGTDGNCATTGFSAIPGNSVAPLSYDANVAAQKNAASNEVIANVVFTINWAAAIGGGTGGGDTENPVTPASYFATDRAGTITGFSDEYFALENAPTDIIIPSSIDGVTTTAIGNYAFRNRSNLTSVTIPDSVTSIGENAFYGCINLARVIIQDGVTDIGDYSFCYCSNLASINIPNSVTSIGAEAFRSCLNITNVNIPDSVTSIGAAVFTDSGLQEITVDENNPNYCSVDGVLFDKAKSTLICCPGGKTGSYEIPNSVTSIGEWAFKGGNLTSVTIPNGVASIGVSAFSDCTKLTSVTIPGSVTSIGGSAFYRCSGLTSVTIPDGVKNIGRNAFANVPHITYHGTATGAPWGAKSMN